MAKLYHVPLSPFCRKVRLVLAEKRIDCALVEERYWEKDLDFLRRNPAGKVPVLRIDGMTLSESTPICEYLEEKYPEPSLMPKTATGRYETRRLVAWFDDKFHHEVTSKLLYERVNKKVMGRGYPDSRNVKDGAKAIKFHLNYLTDLLAERRWLAGDVMTLADFTAAAHLSALDYISDVDWNRKRVVLSAAELSNETKEETQKRQDRDKALKDWYAKIKSRPAFRSILADQISGFPPPAHYADLDF